MKKIISILAVFLIFAMVVAGCAKKEMNGPSIPLDPKNPDAGAANPEPKDNTVEIPKEIESTQGLDDSLNDLDSVE
ncbi:MAG TPA: hypothetical protein VI564_02305 [Candidatus Nanoarchaeia archaeon]|nr:hypothetical protein [Candidatus Nanoarchaeia archaeon]